MKIFITAGAAYLPGSPQQGLPCSGRGAASCLLPGLGVAVGRNGLGIDGGYVSEGEDISNCLLCQHGACPAGEGLQWCRSFVGIR